jgi:hypothetical protein
MKRLAMVASIKEKIGELGMSYNSRKYYSKASSTTQADNKMFNLMKQRRGEGTHRQEISPREELRQIYAGKLELYQYFINNSRVSDYSMGAGGGSSSHNSQPSNMMMSKIQPLIDGAASHQRNDRSKQARSFLSKIESGDKKSH